MSCGLHATSAQSSVMPDLVISSTMSKYFKQVNYHFIIKKGEQSKIFKSEVVNRILSQPSRLPFVKKWADLKDYQHYLLVITCTYYIITLLSTFGENLFELLITVLYNICLIFVHYHLYYHIRKHEHLTWEHKFACKGGHHDSILTQIYSAGNFVSLDSACRKKTIFPPLLTPAGLRITIMES